MNFYLLELLGKWISLAFITICPVSMDKKVVNVEVENENLSKDSSVVATVVKYTTVTKNDPTLEEGKTKIETAGVNGLVYKSENMDISIQTMVPQVVLKGTKKVQKKVTETPKIVYDGLTLEQLSAKLNKNLKSDLKGKGNIYAKYSIEYGVDPYLAVAISLLETGCNETCSNLVKTKHNVGGMMGKNGALSFTTLDEGIQKFIKNLKENYYDYGLTTPEQINPKYATSTTWATKVNKYIEQIKAS
jgi:hypothetical protein